MGGDVNGRKSSSSSSRIGLEKMEGNGNWNGPSQHKKERGSEYWVGYMLCNN